MMVYSHPYICDDYRGVVFCWVVETASITSVNTQTNIMDIDHNILQRGEHSKVDCSNHSFSCTRWGTSRRARSHCVGVLVSRSGVSVGLMVSVCRFLGGKRIWRQFLRAHVQ